jgi:hypothetical protein
MLKTIALVISILKFKDNYFLGGVLGSSSNRLAGNLTIFTVSELIDFATLELIISFDRFSSELKLSFLHPIRISSNSNRIAFDIFIGLYFCQNYIT